MKENRCVFGGDYGYSFLFLVDIILEKGSVCFYLFGKEILLERDSDLYVF